MPAQQRAKLLAAIKDYIQSYENDESKAETLDELRTLEGKISGSDDSGVDRESPGHREAVQAATDAHLDGASRPKAERAKARTPKPDSEENDDPGPPMARTLRRKKKMQRERRPISGTDRGGY